MYTGTFNLLLCIYSRSSLTNTCNIALCSSLKTLSCNFLLSSIKTCKENWSTKSLIHLCHNHYCQNPKSTFYVPFKHPSTPHIYSLPSPKALRELFILLFSRNCLRPRFPPPLGNAKCGSSNTCTNKCKLWKLFD